MDNHRDRGLPCYQWFHLRYASFIFYALLTCLAVYDHVTKTVTIFKSLANCLRQPSTSSVSSAHLFIRETELVPVQTSLLPVLLFCGVDW